MWPSNSALRHMPKKTENVYPHPNLYTDVHSSIIHNNQKVEATRASFHWRWVNKRCSIHTTGCYSQAVQRDEALTHDILRGWTLNTWCRVKAASHRRPHVAAVRSLSCVWLFATPWTVACQTTCWMILGMLNVQNGQNLQRQKAVAA